jgi:hypothetical protein
LQNANHLANIGVHELQLLGIEEEGHDRRVSES